MSARSFGLCDRCAHQRVVRSGRGSAFSMCELGLRDPDWPKYPAMPVRECPRFAARSGATQAGPASGCSVRPAAGPE